MPSAGNIFTGSQGGSILRGWLNGGRMMIAGCSGESGPVISGSSASMRGKPPLRPAKAARFQQQRPAGQHFRSRESPGGGRTPGAPGNARKRGGSSGSAIGRPSRRRHGLPVMPSFILPAGHRCAHAGIAGADRPTAEKTPPARHRSPFVHSPRTMA